MGIKKLVYGVGVNDCASPVEINKVNPDGSRYRWKCPFYRKWSSMLARCYSEVELAKHPSYLDVTVCEDWRIFSRFKSWMENQEWEGSELDKDVINPGSKVYCPENCAFIPMSLNKFLTNINQEFTGVSWHKKTKKFRAQCNNPFSGKREHIGYFHDKESAHAAWVERKVAIAIEIAESGLINDERVVSALCSRIPEYANQLRQQAQSETPLKDSQ